MLYEIPATWRVLLLILAAPVVLWLIAFAGYVLLFVIGALHYALVLLRAYLTLVAFN